MNRVIINADDFGIHTEVNQAVIEACEQGVLTSTSLLANGPAFDEAAILTIDGVRVEYADGFGLARPSNTTPVVVLRFEADNEAAIARIQADFRRAIEGVWPGVQLPF
mgnify:CR=1 FL=1